MAELFEVAVDGVWSAECDSTGEWVDPESDAGETGVAEGGAAFEPLAAGGFTIEGAEIANVPATTVPIEGEAAQNLLKRIDTLEDNDDLQSVSHNAEIPESVGT